MTAGGLALGGGVGERGVAGPGGGVAGALAGGPLYFIVVSTLGLDTGLHQAFLTVLEADWGMVLELISVCPASMRR